MDCPDENSYARMLDGLMAASERVVLERHIDACPSCAELVAQIGKVYAHSEGAQRISADEEAATTLPAQPEAKPPAPAPIVAPRVLARVELFFALIHAAVTWKLMVAAMSNVDIGRSLPLFGTNATLARIAAVYWEAWGPIGCVAALASARGLRRDAPWGAMLARVHAWLSLPSVLLTPLSLYLLAELRPGAHGRRGPRSPQSAV